MVMGVPVAEVIAALGHDDVRGFHPQEMLCVGLKNGWIFSPHEYDPQVEHVECPARCAAGLVYLDSRRTMKRPCHECKGTGIWELEPNVTLADEFLEYWNGVLTGRVKGAKEGHYHAVAWCSRTQLCADPKGMVYPISEFEPDCFWIGAKFDV
jgi:hypothetical protein